jgi:transposase-like protein
MVMKHYPPEFRAEAVAFYRSRPGATIKSVADDLGVNHETLCSWIGTSPRMLDTGLCSPSVKPW